MTIELKRSYLNRIRLRYQNSTKAGKKLILDEFCAVCGYSRKYAIRICQGRVHPRMRKPGRKPQYTSAEFLMALEEIWESTGRINSKMLKAAIPNWLRFFTGFDSHTKSQLLTVSSATIDRLLKPVRTKRPRAMSSTRPSLIKNQIPLKLLDEEIKYPGFVEVDTVAHCGESLSGEFVNTLTMTDLYSGWTENRALWGKTSAQVVRQMKRIESVLPFELVGVASDNGSEFLNYDLHEYLTRRPEPLSFVRRRPYKKNDNAHVEQKNFTHVRQLLGYERLDEEFLVELINEMYQQYFNPLRNHFIPTMKLIKKERIGSRIKKTYDRPQTPYQRILSSGTLRPHEKAILIARHQKLNPVTLAKELNQRLKDLAQYLDKKKQPLLRVANSDTLPFGYIIK